jgi:putative endonuclease
VTTTDPRHLLGQDAERLAALHLERLGYRIVERNHRTRYGEIDIIACDDETLVFVEVKARRGAGRPWDSLHDRKQKQVRRMGAPYLAVGRAPPRARAVRFDAIGVTVDAAGDLVSLDHLEGAF